MIPVRCFTDEGMAELRSILKGPSIHENVATLVADQTKSYEFHNCEIDGSERFGSRYEFGCAIREALASVGQKACLAAESDGLWAWINALFFRQLAPTADGIRREEHYVPVRRGAAGSLLHRNAARTAYELVVTHGTNAHFVLQQKMNTHGQLLESLTASQGIARNRGFFAAAARLYVQDDGKIRRGATSKPKSPRERRAGDESGKGSIRRLPMALRRLDLTFDVTELGPVELIALLPKEFSRWSRSAGD